MTLVNTYYDLVTDFYEYGWGQSFHFAPRYNGESIPASIARHEHFLALRLGLKPGMKVLDIGCGIGGPLSEIARFSGATITGVNNNDYQIGKGRKLIKQYGLENTADFLKADFLHIPVPDNSYDAVYAIEATCHAPTKESIYSEIMRVLKPGGSFVAYEWCMTDKWDPQNARHNDIKKKIELGNGLPNLDTTDEVVETLHRLKLDVVEYKDLAIVDASNPVPWWQPLNPAWSLEGFRTTKLGTFVTHYMVAAMEKVGIASTGSLHTHTVLLSAHEGILQGGKTEIFTPMFYFHVKKPLK